MESHDKIMRNLHQALTELGLSKQEIALYSLSLSTGPASIVSLGKTLGISRPNIYKLIRGLEEHGLAEFSTHKKRGRHLVVASPTVITELLTQKKKQLSKLDESVNSVLPDLLALYRQGDLPTKIKIFEGKDQYRQVFMNILNEAKDTICHFGSADAFIGLISWQTEREFIVGRLKKNISLKALLLPGPDQETLKQNDKKELRETRIFIGEKPFVSSFLLYANKVIIWQPAAPLVILIEDEYIVEMFAMIYNVLWSNALTKQTRDI